MYDASEDSYKLVYMYIYMVTPTTRTPLKNTVNTDTNAVFFFPNPILELFLRIGNTSAKHKKSKNPKTFHIYGIL